MADEAEMTRLKARLYDLELRYADTQPRDDRGRWANGGGGGLSAAQPASSSQPSRGVQVAFGGPAGNTMSDAGGFMLPSGPQPQTAQLRSSEVDLKPQLVQLQGDEQYQVNLKEEEARGGHAIREHVNRSDTDLISEVRRSELPNATRITDQMGTFFSEKDAEEFTNQTIDVNREKIDKIVKQKNGTAEEISARFDSPTGKEAYLPNDDQYATPRIRTTFGVTVYVVSASNSPRGYRVITSYPTNFPSGYLR